MMPVGWRLYVLVAALLAFAGLGAWGYIEYQRAEIASAKVLAVTKERDDLRASLVQAEADKKELVKQQEATDAIVAAQREKERKLEDEKAQVWEQFDRIIASSPKADQDCAALPLPPAVRDFLRDGTGDGQPLRESEDSAKPPSGLHGDDASRADVGQPRSGAEGLAPH